MNEIMKNLFYDFEYMEQCMELRMSDKWDMLKSRRKSFDA